MDLDAFIFFATVVETGSFASAARKLGMDRSNVSRRIRKLELDVGAELIRRTTRQMKLTELGEAFYERCAVISAEVDNAQRVVQSLNATVRGPLHVACHPVMGRTLLAGMFSEFCLKYPDVSMQVTLNGNVEDLVGMGIDVALRIINEPGPSYVARKLADIRWVICASPAYLDRCGAPADPQALTRHAWCGVRQRVSLEFVRAEQHRRVVLFARMQCADYDFLKTTLLAGVGVGMVPAYGVREELAAGRLRTVLSDFRLAPSPGNSLFAMTAATRYTPPQIRAFLDSLKQGFATDPLGPQAGEAVRPAQPAST